LGKDLAMVGKMDNFSESADCRMVRRWQYENILQLIKLLKAEDRVLLELYYQHNVSLGKLALLVGIEPQNISRRIKKILRNLLNNKYQYFLRQRRLFTSLQMEIAYDYFLLGQGPSTIATKRGLSRRAVYLQLSHLQQWLKNEIKNEL
jgi:predicted DNA-binding protein YlxM (UPF0122 family)